MKLKKEKGKEQVKEKGRNKSPTDINDKEKVRRTASSHTRLVLGEDKIIGLANFGVWPERMVVSYRGTYTSGLKDKITQDDQTLQSRGKRMLFLATVKKPPGPGGE